MIVLLLKVSLLLVAALAIAPLLRRSSAAMRHLVCCSRAAVSPMEKRCQMAGSNFQVLSLIHI